MSTITATTSPNSDRGLTNVRFHLFTLKFTPFAQHASDYDTQGIVNSIITHINKEKLEHRAIIVDRNRNRQNEEERSLFMLGAFKDYQSKVFKCSIALLKTGRNLVVKSKNTFSVAPYDDSMGQIAELTHFFIDFSGPNCVICVEFNASGPRFSDIEHYLLAIAKEHLKFARAVDSVCHMEQPVGKTLAELKEATSIEIIPCGVEFCESLKGIKRE